MQASLLTTPFSLTFDESFYTQLLRSRDQLVLLPETDGSWKIAIIKDKKTQTDSEWQLLVEKVTHLFQEIEFYGNHAFAKKSVAELKQPFVDLTLAANMYALQHYLYETPPLESDFILKENGSEKRVLQSPSVSEKARRLETQKFPKQKIIELIDEIKKVAQSMAFNCDHPQDKVRLLCRQDYLDVIPPDVHF